MTEEVIRNSPLGAADVGIAMKYKSKAGNVDGAITTGHAYLQRTKRTCFERAVANVIMAKLLLLTGDADGFMTFRNAALATGECSNEDKIKLSQMYSAWTQVTHTWWWLPEKWRLKLAARVLRRDYPF